MAITTANVTVKYLVSAATIDVDVHVHTVLWTFCSQEGCVFLARKCMSKCRNVFLTFFLH